MTHQNSASDPSRLADSASARIVRSIIRGLYEGRYVSGQRLAEPELMKEFGMGRSTVRESIRRMETEGIVTVLPHRGAVIRKMSAAESINALLVMELCIGLAARQAAERIEVDGACKRLEKTWRELQEHRHSPDGYELLVARNRFYRTIAHLSGNQELQRIISSIQILLIRLDYSLSSHTRFEDCARMVDAILGGDGVAAEAAARKHIARSITLVRRRSNGREKGDNR